MSRFFFEFNLETGKVSKDTMPDYAIRYYRSKNGTIVEIYNTRLNGLLFA